MTSKIYSFIRGSLVGDYIFFMNFGEFVGKDADRLFEEALDAEVSLNLHKITDLAREGRRSNDQRGTLYRLVLGVTLVDKSKEITQQRLQEEYFESLFKQGDSSHAISTNASQWHKRRPLGLPSILSRSSSSYNVSLSWAMQQMLFEGSCEWEKKKQETSDDVSSTTSCHVASPSVILSIGSSFWTALRESSWIVKNLHRRVSFDTGRCKRIDRVLDALAVSHVGASWELIQAMAFFVPPMEAVNSQLADVYFCVKSLVHFIKNPLTSGDSGGGALLSSPEAFERCCGDLLMLLHMTNDNLYQHLQLQSVSPYDWAPSMLLSLLSAHLHTDDVLSLWDTYLTKGLGVHRFVVLAVLEHYTESLLELDRNGILEYLERLGRIDVPQILKRAVAISEFVKRRTKE